MSANRVTIALRSTDDGELTAGGLYTVAGGDEINVVTRSDLFTLIVREVPCGRTTCQGQSFHPMGSQVKDFDCAVRKEACERQIDSGVAIGTPGIGIGLDDGQDRHRGAVAGGGSIHVG